jgi:ASC-1-like (ASCH) protein
MKLYSSGFYWIKDKKQKLEVRLYDEKRQILTLWDIIIFRLLPDLKEEIKAKIVWLLIYPSFKELFSVIDLEKWNAKNWWIEKCIECSYKIYSLEDEKKYWVIWIEIELL